MGDSGRSLSRIGVAATALTLVAACAVVSAPSITIDTYPTWGSWGSATGRVTGVADTTKVRVALFIFAPGSNWWTKPTFAQPTVPVQPDGRWSGVVANGGSDAYLTNIKAFLIPSTLSPPLADGDEAPPQVVVQQAQASAWVFRPDPSQRRITFSGYSWLVKAGDYPQGPDSNYFSDSTDNVWVDAQGRLHLKIRYADGQWRCSEVILSKSLGYGTYRFKLASDVSNIDATAVFGLFTWSNDGSFAHREIDFEFSRWSVPGDALNAQYVIQPFDGQGNRHRWTLPPGQTASTHTFAWRPFQISFRSLECGGSELHRWSYDRLSGIPPAQDEQVRLNLWLFQHAPPASGQPVEVVIEKFEFEPYSIGIRAKALTRAPATEFGSLRVAVWGRVSEASTHSFSMNDGSSQPVLVNQPIVQVSDGDFAIARGLVSASDPLTLVADEVVKVD